MRSTTEIAALCEQIALDTQLGAVRAYQEKTGQKAIGHLPIYAPREVIQAAGMLPVGILGGGDQIEIIRGDAYFQSYICQIPRSVVEMGLTARLDCLSGMLFPAICDVIRNLSGVWQLLFPEKYVRYIDVPQNEVWEIGGRFYMHDLRELGRELGQVSGTAPTDESLRAAIRAHNEVRRLIRELYDLRAKRPELVPTAEAYVLVRAGYQLPAEEHAALLREYMDAARESKRPALDQARVIVIGTFCEQPPLGLLKTLERAGCYIVDDDLILGARFLTSDVDETIDPWEALARAYLQSQAHTSSRYRPEEQKGRYLVDRCKQRGAEGVIFCAPSFCDPALLEQPMLEAALDRAGIQHTAFKYAENTAQFQAIHEQAGTFSDSIRLWSLEA
ncbi:MAG: benzoyl-CoA reductase subunit C [Byssovorax sp.]